MTTTARHTADRDQYDAATADANRRLAAILAQPGARTVAHPHPWIVRQLADLRAALLAGTARLCSHIGPSPMVVHAAVWDRWHLVCSACIRALIPNVSEDFTCDRCRRPADLMHPGAAGCGPLLLTFGLCSRCAHHTGLAAATRRARPKPTRRAQRVHP